MLAASIDGATGHRHDRDPIRRPAWASACAGIGNHCASCTDDEARGAAREPRGTAAIRHFDTAPHYGLGLSERRLGAFLATRAARPVRRVHQGRPAAGQPNPDGRTPRRRGLRRAGRPAADVGLHRGGCPPQPRRLADSPRASTTSTSCTCTTRNAGTSQRPRRGAGGAETSARRRCRGRRVGVGSMAADALLAARSLRTGRRAHGRRSLTAGRPVSRRGAAAGLRGERASTSSPPLSSTVACSPATPTAAVDLRLRAVAPDVLDTGAADRGRLRGVRRAAGGRRPPVPVAP